MTGKNWQCVGLFMAAIAAFSLACGNPQVVFAATPDSPVEQALNTAQGRAALARAGISPDQFKTMLQSLSPEQRARLDEMASDMTPRAILAARMTAQGYTKPEVDERLAVLTQDEVASLAGNPEATVGGAGVGSAIFILALVIVACLVVFYFAFWEPAPSSPPPPAPAEPAPAPST